jgi:DNA repair protein RadD
MQLRPYQEEILVALREQLKQGKRAIVLYAPTGAGKTETAIALLSAARQKNNRSAMILDRIVLVNQTSERLDKYAIDHGVMQSGHWRFRPYEHIQVCSAQTLERRGKMEHVSLLIIDECHAVRRQTVEFIKANPQVKVVGLSATPFSKGMGRTYDGIVSTVTTKQLVDQNVLVPLRVYIAKEIDMTGAKKVGGEWTTAAATDRSMKIVGDVVTEWISKTHEIFGKPVKSIVFSCGVEHGIELSKKFREHGYNFVCVSYRDDDKFKSDIIEDFKRPDTTIHGLIATDILTKGFDCPDVLIGVSARPFSKSLGSHIQQMGRVMRGFPGKEFGVWLCFSGNYIRFREDWDDVYENGVNSLDDNKEKPKKEKTEAEKEDSKCPQCAALWERGWKSCAYCGFMKTRPSTVESVPGEMQELSAATKEEKQTWWSMCRYKVAIDGWSSGRAAHTYKEKFGVWPRGLDDAKYLVPDEAFEGFVKAQLKKYLRKVHAIRGKK